MLTIADGLIILVVFLSTVISWFRGFVREVLSLLAWIGAFFVAFNFSHPFANAFSNYVKTPSIRIALAFTLLFIGTFLLISVVNFCINLLINRIGLSGIDRVCGAFVGILRGILLVALALLLVKLTPMTEDSWWKHSFLIPKFEPIESWLQSFMPEYVEKHPVSED